MTSTLLNLKYINNMIFQAVIRDGNIRKQKLRRKEQRRHTSDISSTVGSHVAQEDIFC